jgi:hypothetical protein
MSESKNENKFPLGETVITRNAKDRLTTFDVCDALKRHHRGDWGVWLLWTVELAQVRVLSILEVMSEMVAEFRKDGPELGYNGDVGPIATLFWEGDEKAYADLQICAPRGFDVEKWKISTLGRYKALLALAGVEPGDGRKARP